MKIIHWLLDLIFPKSDTLVALESLSPDEIYSRFQKSGFVRQNIFAIFSYKNKMVKEMLWRIKFHGDRRLARKCGKLLYRVIIEKLPNAGNYLLIPVPIHPKRRRERGFNQCEWLCEEIMRCDGVSCNSGRFSYRPDLVVRDIYKVKQSWSKKEERLKNIRNVFRVVSPEKIIGQNIIIIDDVVTTGATLQAIFEVMKNSGASTVVAFTVAH